jgi:hypothetical protein
VPETQTDPGAEGEAEEDEDVESLVEEVVSEEDVESLVDEVV